MMKVAILGSGVVGQALARGFLKYGNEVIIGTQNPAKKIDWQEAPAKPPAVVTYERAAQFGDILVLAVKGTVAEDVARAFAANAAGKTVIDASNPIADLPPENGVLRFFTDLDESLMERLQKLAPGAFRQSL
jgi:predicted dinucleotide-binding enzyme